MSLLKTRMDWLQLNRNAAADGSTATPKVLVAATFTADPVAPYLGMLLTGDAPQPASVSIAPYNQIIQICQSWNDDAEDGPPDAVVILWRIEDLARRHFQAFLRGGSADELVARVEELAAAIATLRQRFKGVVLAAMPPFPHSPDHDIHSLQSASHVGALHRRILDLWVTRMMALEGVSLFDLDGLQRAHGIQNTVDWRKWYLYRQPFTEVFWSAIADGIYRLLSIQRSSAKKCVVLDCDNTLWGGIIGEDGLEGILLGEDYPGSAYSDFQSQLLTLRSQGVILAICSKNNEADVWEVFDKHDGMLLKRNHIVAHRINWLDKPSNIIGIAEELNIGLDSLVFVDDSLMEIEHVRAALPTVTCIQAPSDTSAFPIQFLAYRGFDRESVSAEDRARSDMMLQEHERQKLATSVSGEAFRSALQLKVDVFGVRPEHVARVHQLINKTNQFNLTTVRKTNIELVEVMNDPQASVLAWRVEDRFGDYGLVGVAILKFDANVAEIETLLMSCRVLGRGVEASVVASLCKLARERGATQLVGTYRKTNKNELVASLYRDHGFCETGPGVWVLDDLNLAQWPPEIERLGL